MKFLILALFVGTAFAGEDVLFYVHGGARLSYKSDKVLVTSDRKVRLTTISPTFASTPNMIGEFSTSLSEEQYKTLLSKTKGLASKVTSEKPESAGLMIEELHIGKDVKTWLSDSKNPAIPELRKDFLVIAKDAYKNPVKALKLECSQQRGDVKCAYVNVGKEVVETVNPLGVADSVQCLDVTNGRTILHKIEEYDPRKMKPAKVKIKPGEKYSFSVKTNEKCDYRIVVKTTDLLINENYEDVLLGELFSNNLTTK